MCVRERERGGCPWGLSLVGVARLVVLLLMLLVLLLLLLLLEVLEVLRRLLEVELLLLEYVPLLLVALAAVELDRVDVVLPQWHLHGGGPGFFPSQKDLPRRGIFGVHREGWVAV